MSREIKGYPHKQEFCINGSRCKSKVKSWWNPNSDTYWVKRKSAKKGTSGLAAIDKIPGLPVVDEVIIE